MKILRTLRAVSWSIGFVAAIFLVVPRVGAQQRPRITGISHVGYFVSNLSASLVFWHDFLGFDESYELKKPGSDEVQIAFIKINDHQHIELFNEPPTNPPNMMSHICFTVDNVEQMKAYLRSQGIDVKAGNGAKTRAGDYAFEVKDPDGMLVEFVQSLPDGMEAKAAGKLEPETRISTKIYHAGFMVGDSVKSKDFYGRILGFKEIWRGGANPKELSWINMQVPDGTDSVRSGWDEGGVDGAVYGGWEAGAVVDCAGSGEGQGSSITTGTWTAGDGAIYGVMDGDLRWVFTVTVVLPHSCAKGRA